MDITLSREQYEALLDLANSTDRQQTSEISDEVDRSNNIIRYYLFVRWQEVGGQPPPRIELGKGWPTDSTQLLVQERAFTRNDVDAYLEANTINPVTIHVTKDPKGEVGWYELNAYPW